MINNEEVNSAKFWFSISIKSDIKDDYDYVKELGRGSTAVVSLVRQKKSKELFAVKEISKKKEKKIPSHEISILLNVSHPNIINLTSIYETISSVYLVLEYVSGGELFDSIVSRRYYSEQDAAKVVLQLLEAVSYLHSKQIVHRDLKPENLLYSNTSSEAVLKVADFGLSKIDSGNTLRTICGTPGYVAPEILLGQSYNQAVDIWAIGVITYILLCGYEPFYAEQDEAMFRKILKCDYSFNSPNWDQISAEAKDLVQKMLILQPDKRITATEAIQHMWVQGKSAKAKHMVPTVKKMKIFNARRKVCSISNFKSNISYNFIKYCSKNINFFFLFYRLCSM